MVEFHPGLERACVMLWEIAPASKAEFCADARNIQGVR
jgi:hypothetical protein